MRHGRWRAGCVGCFAADVSSIWVAATDCSRSSCCCSTILRPQPSSWTGGCHLRARSCTRCWFRPGRGCRGESRSSPSGSRRFEILGGDVVVSSHACGQLTDLVIERAVAARARVAVLPCCHDLAACDTGGLAGWVAGPIAVDILRAIRLGQRGYRIWTQTIPATVTPKNRLLLGAPKAGSA